MTSMRTYSRDNFIETKKKVTITFSGWDGKSYNGEPRTCKVYTHPMHPGKEFVRGYFRSARCYHLVTDNCHQKSGERMVDFFTNIEPDNR